MKSRSFGFALVCASVLVPAVASAHVRLTDPAPRSNSDALKNGGPCGGVAAGASKKTYFGDQAAAPAGAQIKVDFEETIGHRGCYQAWLSLDGKEAAQGDFMKLAQVNDPANSQGKQSMMLSIPAGTKCDKCVLQFTQVMLNAECPANQMPNGGGLTYFSCSDIKIGGAAAGGDGGASGDAGASSSSGSSGSPADGGTSSGGTSSGSTSGGTSSGGTSSGSASPDDDDDDGTTSGGERGRSGLGGNDGGCNAGGSPVGASTFAALGLGVLVASRRRRRA